MAPLLILLVKALIPIAVKEVVTKAVQPKELEMNEVIAGLVRHGLTVAGGILVAKGYTDSGTVEAVSGALVTIIGVVWSVLAKRKAS